MSSSSKLRILNDADSDTSAGTSAGCGSATNCSSEELSASDLLSVQKPAQYIGGELNAIVKDDADVSLHFALGFPDTYEVGMSHIGMQILYSILNEREDIWAERVYMPEADMEQLLREKQKKLTSLEAKRTLADFDIVGISLQYELCATNILAMLELGGIAFHAADRDDDAPLVIGGGPYSYHPEALSPFFDAFFLGDAEEGVLDVSDVVVNWKKRHAAGDATATRAQLLEALSEVEGIYVPTMFVPHYRDNGSLERIEARNPEKTEVVRRLLPTMEGAPFPTKPVVPNIRTIHNRLSIEVMRGCVRGCRFCQAGYLYRPQRERSPQEILELVDASLPESGYEELSLLSLSTADYCSVVPLLKQLMDKYANDDKLAVSFPSTRVDSLTPEVLEQVQRVRRTGFTVAPEAGTQRLRDVINKGVSDEQILETCQNVFTMGWSGIKLYFMLGLPTETDEDLHGIISIAQRVKALPAGRGKDITVSVSTHVPKPHTPFQWAEQITPQETIRKQRLLADGLRKIGVNFRYHNSFSTFLEGVFCRADRDLSRVIVRAYELGCRLDAWSEHLDEEKWMQAFLDCDIDPSYYLRERAVDETLPWEHLSCGIPKSYFLKEYRRALRDRSTPDCLTKSCSVCGACNYDDQKNILWPRHETEEAFGAVGLSADTETLTQPVPVARYRLAYRKDGPFRYVGHLELAHVFHRAARRAGLPIAYSRGFHPMPKFAFGPPTPLGVESSHEFVDVYLTTALEPEVFKDFYNQTLPEEVKLVDVQEVPISMRSLSDSICALKYRLEWSGKPEGLLGEWLESNDSSSDTTELISRVMSHAIVRSSDKHGEKNPKKRKRRAKTKEFLLAEHLSSCELHWTPAEEAPNALSLELRFNPSRAAPRITEIAVALTGFSVGDCRIIKEESCFGSREPVLSATEPEQVALASNA